MARFFLNSSGGDLAQVALQALVSRRVVRDGGVILAERRGEEPLAGAVGIFSIRSARWTPKLRLNDIL
jgi:hypothetical protein